MKTRRNTAKLLWRAIMIRYKKSWFWRLFGVCAMESNTKRFLLAIVLVVGTLTYTACIELLNPVLPLKAMDRHEGILARAEPSPGNTSNYRLYIKTDAGEELEFIGYCWDDKALIKASVGQRVVLYSQHYYDGTIPPRIYERYFQMETADRILIRYNYKRRLSIRNNGEKSYFKFILTLSLGSLLLLFVLCFKKTFLDKETK